MPQSKIAQIAPNPAVERTGRFMASASVGTSAAGRSP